MDLALPQGPLSLHPHRLLLKLTTPVWRCETLKKLMTLVMRRRTVLYHHSLKQEELKALNVELLMTMAQLRRMQMLLKLEPSFWKAMSLTRPLPTSYYT